MTPPPRLVPDRPSDAAQQKFAEWFAKNYPGPDTIIGDPHWHAPRIFRAVQYAIDAAAPPAEAPAESSSKRALKREIARLQTELAKRIAAPAAPAEGDSDAAIVAARLDECLPTVETMCGKNAGYALRDAAAMLRRLSAPRVTGGREDSE